MVLEVTRYRMRLATPADLAIVLRHRRRMFEDMGFADERGIEEMLRHSAPMLERGLAGGTYHGWLVEAPEGQVVAGGGILSLEFQSHPRDPEPRRAWVVNMYTEPEHRRRGLARRLMDAMLAWCRDRGLRSLYLHASVEGRPLYERLGFEPTNEMRIDLGRARTHTRENRGKRRSTPARLRRRRRATGGASS